VTETAQLAHSLIGPAAIAPITDRAFLRITGPDATRWLNGMVTNNIKDLAPGQGNYNFLLNAQGRIQADCTIYREPNEGEPTFLLEADSSQREAVHQTLDRFIIMDDVELSRSDMTGLLIVGDKAYEVLCDAQLPPSIKAGATPQPSRLLGHLHWSALLGRKSWTVQPPSMGGLHYEVWSPEPSDVTDLRTKLLSLDAVELSPETLESLRILEGRPKYGTDIRDRDLPQETAQTHALNFNKGCYLGQEIVERIHSRGQVHRTFTQFTLTGDLPMLPAPLTANEKPAGELTSAARIGDRIYALGYIRREILETHQPITYPHGTATPR
jgi:folate-binding protein YgfZ